MTDQTPTSKPTKAKIPVALREQMWLRDCGPVYEATCTVSWCKNKITVFDFHAGHNIPESKTGGTVLENLAPICSRCNLSMGNRYTISEWCTLGGPATLAVKRKWWRCY